MHGARSCATFPTIFFIRRLCASLAIGVWLAGSLIAYRPGDSSVILPIVFRAIEVDRARSRTPSPLGWGLIQIHAIIMAARARPER